MATYQLVTQRVRNRVIETLELVLESQDKPPERGFNSLINGWDDWTFGSSGKDIFPAPVYTKEEDRCLREVIKAFDAFCEATPESITDEMSAFVLPQWRHVGSAARQAHAEIMKRGRFSEDQELAP